MSPLLYMLQFFLLLHQGQLWRPMNSSVGQYESLNLKGSIFSQGSFPRDASPHSLLLYSLLLWVSYLLPLWDASLSFRDGENRKHVFSCAWTHGGNACGFSVSQIVIIFTSGSFSDKTKPYPVTEQSRHISVNENFQTGKWHIESNPTATPFNLIPHRKALN